MVEFAEVNPTIGSAQEIEKTVKSTIDAIASFYGNRRRGCYTPDYSIPEVPVPVRRSSINCLSNSDVRKCAR